MRYKRYEIVSLAIFIVSFLAAVQAAGADKTMTRIDDPVVVEAKLFTALLGSDLEKLSLMARKGEAWAPVPFQIDQKKPDGAYAFTTGPEASADPDPSLDANDELVFMAKDCGDQVEDFKYPESAEAMMELTLSDPKDGSRGWLYLTRFSAKAPRSSDDYIKVELDPANNFRKVFTYEYIMGGPMDVIYPSHMAGSKLPSGEPGKDVLDRLKMRGDIVLPLGIRIPFAMDDITKCEDKGYIDGPVRVLHLAQGYLELTAYIKIKGEGYSMISYYVNHMIWPMVMEIPAIEFVDIENFLGYMDFNENVYGSCVFNAANPYNPEVIFDGRITEAENAFDTTTEIDWVAGFGPQGAIIHRLFFDPPEACLRKRPYFIDDPSAKGKPEDHPGEHGAGYSLTFPDKPLPASTVHQYYYYMNTLKPEEVSRILDILDHPIEVGAEVVDLTAKPPPPPPEPEETKEQPEKEE